MHRDPSIFMVPPSNPSNSTVDKIRINPNHEVSSYAIDIFNCKNCKKGQNLMIKANFTMCVMSV